MPHRVLLGKLSGKSRFALGVVLIAVCVFAVFVGVDQILRIRAIQVVRPDDYAGTDAQVRNLQGLESWQGRNILFVSPDSVRQAVIDANPTLKSASVEKKYPGTLIITVRLYQPFAQFGVNRGYFVLSEDSRILAKRRDRDPVLPVVSYYQKLNYDS